MVIWTEGLPAWFTAYYGWQGIWVWVLCRVEKFLCSSGGVWSFSAFREMKHSASLLKLQETVCDCYHNVDVKSDWHCTSPFSYDFLASRGIHFSRKVKTLFHNHYESLWASDVRLSMIAPYHTGQRHRATRWICVFVNRMCSTHRKFANLDPTLIPNILLFRMMGKLLSILQPDGFFQISQRNHIRIAK